MVPTVFVLELCPKKKKFDEKLPASSSKYCYLRGQLTVPWKSSQKSWDKVFFGEAFATLSSFLLKEAWLLPAKGQWISLGDLTDSKEIPHLLQ